MGCGGPLGSSKGLAQGSRRPRPSLEGRRASRRGSRDPLQVRGAGETKLAGGAHGSAAGRTASGLSGRRGRRAGALTCGPRRQRRRARAGRREAGPCGKGAGQRSEGLGRGGKRVAGRGGKKGSWADGVLGPGWVLAGFPFLILFYSISKANTQILIEFKLEFESNPNTQTK